MTIPEENQRSDTDRALGSPANFYWWAGMLVSFACIGVLPLITTWGIGPVALGGVLLSVLLWIRGILGQAVRAVFITVLFLAGGLLAMIAIHPRQPETSLSILLVALVLAGIVVWRTWGIRWDFKELLDRIDLTPPAIQKRKKTELVRYRAHRPGTPASSFRYYRIERK